MGIKPLPQYGYEKQTRLINTLSYATDYIYQNFSRNFQEFSESLPKTYFQQKRFLRCLLTIFDFPKILGDFPTILGIFLYRFLQSTVSFFPVFVKCFPNILTDVQSIIVKATLVSMGW